MTVEKDGKCAFSDGSASVFMVFCPLIVAFFAFIALFLVDVSILDEKCVLTSWATHQRLLVKWVLIFLRRYPPVYVCSVNRRINQSDFFIDSFSDLCDTL